MRSINIENSRQNSIKVFSSLKETSLEEITRCTMMLKFANPSSLDSRELSNWNKGQESFSNASKSQPFWKKEAFPSPAWGLCDQVLLHLVWQLDYKDALIPVGTAQGREKPYQQKKVLCEIKPG